MSIVAKSLEFTSTLLTGLFIGNCLITIYNSLFKLKTHLNNQQASKSRVGEIYSKD